MFLVEWSTEHSADGYLVDSIERGKKECIDILKMWAFQTGSNWFGIRMPTQDEIDDWDQMIQNSYVCVIERPDYCDATKDVIVWEPSVDDVTEMLFVEWDCMKEEYEEILNSVSA